MSKGQAHIEMLNSKVLLAGLLGAIQLESHHPYFGLAHQLLPRADGRTDMAAPRWHYPDF